MNMLKLCCYPFEMYERDVVLGPEVPSETIWIPSRTISIRDSGDDPTYPPRLLSSDRQRALQRVSRPPAPIPGI